MLLRCLAAGVAAIVVPLVPATPALAVPLMPARAWAPGPPVTKRLAVVMIQNGDTPTEQTQLTDEPYARTVFFGPSNSLATWMPAVTHGLLRYTEAGAGVYLVPPNVALSTGDRDATCLSEAARTTAEDYLNAQSVGWDAVAILFDIGAGCTWAGLGQMPGKVTWYTPRPSLSVIVHEFGHNQGYPHENKRDCASGLIANCKPGDTSGNTPMGSGGAGRGYSSVELLHSKWAETDWFKQTSAPGTYSLKPLYAPLSVTGTRIVEFTMQGNVSYVIEARAQGTDADTGVTSPGIRVYSVTSHDYKNAWMVNPAGSTVITDAANGVVITIRSATSVSIAALAASASPSAPASLVPSEAAPSPSPSTVDDDVVLVAEPSRSFSATDGSSPPWLAFGIAAISLAGLGAAFAFLGGRRGRHRRARAHAGSHKYSADDHYVDDYHPGDYYRDDSYRDDY
jgi:hypothetical protein